MRFSHRFQVCPALRGGLPLLVLLGLALPPLGTAQDTKIIGTERETGVIYAIDPATGDAEEVGETAGVTSPTCCSANGNAFEPAMKRLYFTNFPDDPATLWFNDLQDPDTNTNAGSLVGPIASGGFYDWDYYYVRNSSDDLYKVDLAFDGTVRSQQKIADLTGDSVAFNFGDIAISPDGILFGSANPGGTFFRLDLNTPNSFTVVATNVPSMQLAFGEDGATLKLYGHSTADGKIFEIDPTNGNLTEISTVDSSDTAGDGGMTDLASFRNVVEVAEGRMTGGGSVFHQDNRSNPRVTHGMTLHCASGPNQLEVNWAGNVFHMELLTAVACFDFPELDERNPTAGFDTIVGTGVGRLNGQPGATIEFRFVDDGEPGFVSDTATMIVADGTGLVLDVSGTLTRGNHQAHRETGPATSAGLQRRR